ncbi:hypothetical protein E2320_022186 [Naja naja]|nr:hypothetical protein E2320_022186 [Naja naja]
MAAGVPLLVFAGPNLPLLSGQSEPAQDLLHPRCPSGCKGPASPYLEGAVTEEHQEGFVGLCKVQEGKVPGWSAGAGLAWAPLAKQGRPPLHVPGEEVKDTPLRGQAKWHLLPPKGLSRVYLTAVADAPEGGTGGRFAKMQGWHLKRKITTESFLPTTRGLGLFALTQVRRSRVVRDSLRGHSLMLGAKGHVGPIGEQHCSRAIGEQVAKPVLIGVIHPLGGHVGRTGTVQAFGQLFHCRERCPAQPKQEGGTATPAHPPPRPCRVSSPQCRSLLWSKKMPMGRLCAKDSTGAPHLARCPATLPRRAGFTSVSV